MSTEEETIDTHDTELQQLRDEVQTLRAQNKVLEEQLAAAKQTAEAAIRRERISLATAPVPRARRP
jgi:phage shock protein A